MKKFAVLIAVVALFAVAAPTFAATNPFMDVPMNSWAYDAVASLAAKGILSGYPDGLYKGKQSMTRYEAASAIARALAYVDMTKANKQDVEMLKKLVVEFKDELDALGVRVDGIEGDFKKMNSRLGGWRFSGLARTDLDYRSQTDGWAAGADYKELGIWQNRMRLFVERWFGENESMYFNARINAGAGHVAGDQGMNWRRFFITMPAFADSKFTVGRFAWEMESFFFNYTADPTGRYGTGAWFSDYEAYGFGWDKTFGIGRFRATLIQNDGAATVPRGYNAVLLTANVDLNLHEKFRANLGGQYIKNQEAASVAFASYNWSKIFTGWFGMRFDFVEDVFFAGTVYFQNISTASAWNATGFETGGTAYRLGLGIGQSVLKFTDFSVEYAKIPEGFYVRSVVSNVFATVDDFARSTVGDNAATGLMAEAKILRLNAKQRWNDKWASWLLWERATGAGNGSISGFGVGVNYQYNANTNFGLNYMAIKASDIVGFRDEGRIRFTTQVTF